MSAKAEGRITLDLNSYDYDTWKVNSMLNGSQEVTKGLGRSIRGWVRQKRIKNVQQYQKNAKLWFNAHGVLEAWKLWANHRHLDFEADMPPDVRRLHEAIEGEHSVVSATHSVETPQGNTVTVIVPFGTEVKIVHQSPAA